MATVTSTQSIPNIIRNKLRLLRMRLTGWMLVNGLAWLLGCTVALVAFDIVVDRFLRMDFSQRVIMLCLMGIVLLTVLFFKIIKPLLNVPTDDALILEVEDKNKQLKQSLISSVQFSRHDEATVASKGMSASLVQTTIEHGVKQAKAINFGSALNAVRGGYNWVLLLIFAGLLGFVGYKIYEGGFFKTWFNRNILLTNDQWPQDTYLIIPDAVDGQIIAARGSDLTLRVLVDDKRSNVTDVEVTLERETNGNRSREKMRRSKNKPGEPVSLEHVTIIGRVESEFRFRARGGDDVTQWVQVKLVDAPTVFDLQLTANLPEYIGKNRTQKLDGSGPHPILRGSTVSLIAKMNKPLRKAQLKTAGGTLPPIDLEETDDPLVYKLTLDGDKIPEAKTKYEFYLEDQGGEKMLANRPVAFTLKTVDDSPPVIRPNLNGIQGLVIPRAFLPFTISASDQYGLEKMAFKYEYKGNDNSVKIEKTIDIPLKKEKPTDSSVYQNAILDLRPEKIPTGVTLKVTILAWDNQPGAKPGELPKPGQSREFLLRVVTEEEFRADLLRREIEQRNAFEQSYNNQLELQSEIRTTAAARPQKAADPSKQDEIVEQFFLERENKIMALQRRQKIIGTNVQGVGDRFKAFLVEAANNRLDESDKLLEKKNDQGEVEDGPRKFKDRLTEDIITPIGHLENGNPKDPDSGSFFAVLKSIEGSRRMVRQRQFSDKAEEAANLQERILRDMQNILRAMSSSASDQKIINALIEIKKAEDRLKDNAERKKDEPDDFDFFEDDGKKDGKSKQGKKNKKGK